MTSALVSSLGRAWRAGWTLSGVRQALALAASALLLPASQSLAQVTSGGQDATFAFNPADTTVFAINYVDDVNDVAGPTVKISYGGSNGFGSYLSTAGVEDATFLYPDFGNRLREIYTIVPERAPAEGNFLPNLLFGGLFGRWAADNSLPRNIIRIMPSGAMDTVFLANIGAGANNFVTSILPLSDGRIVVGGEFTTFNLEPRKRIVRLLNSGSIDESFATGSNIDDNVLVLAEGIDPATGTADGTTLVGGIFNTVAGQNYGKLARLDPNGNLDMSFHPIIDTRVTALYVQPSGKIIIGGDFTNVNGTVVSHLARLNYDGSLDTTFNCSVTGVPNHDVNPTSVYCLTPMSDGRIYVGGEFANINGTARIYLGLISADGVLDSTFDPAAEGTAIYNSVQVVAIQADNKILVGETIGPKIGKSYVPSLVRLFGATPGVAAAADRSSQVQQSQPAVVTKRSIRETTVPTATKARAAAGRYIW